jgi:hypothetical protein
MFIILNILSIVSYIIYYMYKIKIFCPFATSKNCKDIYEKINYTNEIGFYGKERNVFITDEDDYTHAILINTIMPDLKIPKQNVVGLAFEPVQFLGITNTFIEYAQKHIGKYYIGDNNALPSPFIEHFGYMWHSRPSREITYKPNLMSIVVSNKKFAPGHIYRHQLVEQIIQLNLPIDIYGYGSNNYSYNRSKGSFNDVEPYETYYFSICIENFVCNHYFSEKIITPLLHNCMPVYFGCKNINSYFDNILKLSGNINNDILLLVEIIKNPKLYYNTTYNQKNIKTVNLIENVQSLYS